MPQEIPEASSARLGALGMNPIHHRLENVSSALQITSTHSLHNTSITDANSSITPTTSDIAPGVCGFVTVDPRNGATLSTWAAVKLSIFPSGLH
jgi:hypothetical protein